jgi:hypothetical protein
MSNPSHDLDIEPTATASSPTDHAGFQSTNHVDTEDPKSKVQAVPDAVEIIDVDELPDPPQTLVATKQEPDIKAEPDTDGLSWALEPFMTWHNTSADPIVIEDDVDTQIHGQTCQAQSQVSISPMSTFESGLVTMPGKHDTQIPKGGIMGMNFQERLRSVQQTFFNSLRNQPNVTAAPQSLGPLPAITPADELDTDEMDIDTSDDEAKESWEG